MNFFSLRRNERCFSFGANEPSSWRPRFPLKCTIDPRQKDKSFDRGHRLTRASIIIRLQREDIYLSREDLSRVGLNYKLVLVMDRYIKFESWYRLWGMDFNRRHFKRKKTYPSSFWNLNSTSHRWQCVSFAAKRGLLVVGFDSTTYL